MAMTFNKSSEDYLKKIDLEIERLQKLRAQVAIAIESDETVTSAPKGKRSDEARERMAASQKARWTRKKAADKRAAKTQAAAPLAKKATAKKKATQAAAEG
jgi:hypothetical protein